MSSNAHSATVQWKYFGLNLYSENISDLLPVQRPARPGPVGLLHLGVWGGKVQLPQQDGVHQQGRLTFIQEPLGVFIKGIKAQGPFGTRGKDVFIAIHPTYINIRCWTFSQLDMGKLSGKHSARPSLRNGARTLSVTEPSSCREWGRDHWYRWTALGWLWWGHLSGLEISGPTWEEDLLCWGIHKQVLLWLGRVSLGVGHQGSSGYLAWTIPETVWSL